MASLTADDVRQIRHLTTLDAAEAGRVAGEVMVRTYEPREFVMAEGEPCRGFYQVVSGRARLFRTGPEGREQIMRLLQPGDTFGEVAVFDSGPNPATVQTLEDSTILLVPSATFRRLVHSHPAVAMDLLTHFSRRLRSFTELVEQISMQTVQQRVARYVYMAAREEGRQTPEGLVISRTITLQDLASLVGSVREVVSRTLHVLETDGIVEVRRKEIVILDLPRLRRQL